MIEISDSDLKFMNIALRLAKRGLGQTWPNPSVGCVLVHSQSIVGRGWTQTGGRPHAETKAIDNLQERFDALTAYVTLEPCSHHGKTPPCAEALISAGVMRCVVATTDPDPRVAGKGIHQMKTAGIEVEVGLLGEEARDINEGFLSCVTQSTPMTTLKVASSLDGLIATGSGDSKWITGSLARARGHLMRAEHDAILIGVETATKDNPNLTCRLPGMLDRSPVRIVLDTHLSLPLSTNLVSSANKLPTWIVTSSKTIEGKVSSLEAAGVEVMWVDTGDDGRLLISEVMKKLSDRGITRLLVEGGQGITTSLLKADLVDRISWFRAPFLIGGDGLGAVGAIGTEKVELLKRLRRVSVEQLGEDTLECFARWK